MPLILENFLIRKRHEALPEGSSGYAVYIQPVFLSRLADGAIIRGTLKQGTTEHEITFILEKDRCDSYLQISREDWTDAFTVGRADVKLNEALKNGTRTRLYENRDVITSPAHFCRISSSKR